MPIKRTRNRFAHHRIDNSGNKRVSPISKKQESPNQKASLQEFFDEEIYMTKANERKDEFEYIETESMLDTESEFIDFQKNPGFMMELPMEFIQGPNVNVLQVSFISYLENSLVF